LGGKIIIIFVKSPNLAQGIGKKDYRDGDSHGEGVKKGILSCGKI